MKRIRSNQGALRPFARNVTPQGMLLGMVLIMGLAVGSCGGGDSGGESARTASLAHLPPEYELRLDRPNRDRTDFVATVHDDTGNLTVRTGPAGILYRSDDVTESERYTLRGRFTEIGAPTGHREGFGLFIGGHDLDGSGQQYLYFLVRGDGHYLIKQRNGAATTELSQGWQPSDAVRVPMSAGEELSNELAIVVDGDQVRLTCNGQPIADLPVGDLSTRGVVGVRVNHNLWVRIEGFGVE